MKVKNFLIDMAKGAAMGVAVIIPGVSGGTIAVLLNIYDKFINAVSNIFKDFKASVKTLAPILSGIVLAIAAAYFPIKYALKYIPFPTVMLFAGLMIGSCPKLIKDGVKNGFSKLNAISVILPLAAVIGICFIPGLGEVDLTADMPVYGYFLLVIVGMAASCALIVPGISGSMLLLILGYYAPLFDSVSALKTDFLHSFLVLALFGIGILIGFFTIAKLMKWLMKKYTRGTYWAIVGFVIGSIPALIITYNSNFPEFGFAALTAPHIAAGVVLAVAGIIATYALTAYVDKKNKAPAVQDVQTDESEQNTDSDSPD